MCNSVHLCLICIQPIVEVSVSAITHVKSAAWYFIDCTRCFTRCYTLYIKVMETDSVTTQLWKVCSLDFLLGLLDGFSFPVICLREFLFFRRLILATAKQHAHEKIQRKLVAVCEKQQRSTALNYVYMSTVFVMKQSKSGMLSTKYLLKTFSDTFSLIADVQGV